jgi:hypothetical protein
MFPCRYISILWRFPTDLEVDGGDIESKLSERENKTQLKNATLVVIEHGLRVLSAEAEGNDAAPEGHPEQEA